MASLVNEWHEWLCHTNFSFLVGASHPGELLERAVQLGYCSLGVADYDGVYGIARTWNSRREMRRENRGLDLRLHYGAEVHLEKDHDLPAYLQDTLVLYARTRRGSFNLCRLLSYSHRDGKSGANIPLDHLLAAAVDDLVAIQPMRGLIRRREGQDAAFLGERFGRLREHFAGRLYFVVSRHLNRVEDRWIGPTRRLAGSLGAPIIFSQDAFFADRGGKPLSDLLHAIRHNRTLDEIPEQLFVNTRRCLHALASLQKIYGDLPGAGSALRNAAELSRSFAFDLDELTYHYPREMIPEGYTPQSYLEKLVWQCAAERFGSPLPQKVESLLHHELSLVEKLRFADYFLTVWDIVRWARSREILCQGRGSAANSAICYVLGITAVNPDKFDLLFERFISVERGDPPDIDVDFENGRREEVIQYIYERYGRNRAAMVCNVITFKSRGAIRFAGKALGVPEGLIDRVSKALGTITARTRTNAEMMGEVRLKTEADGSLPVLPDHTWNWWMELSERLYGFPRFLGVHSGGFMLSDRDVDWLVPQEPATMEGRTVIQWCKEDIEALGFFKIDILALGMLTAIRRCLEMLAKYYGKPLRLATIPADDPETYAMIRRAETVGVFQIESAAQRASLPVLLPQNFYDLVVQVAIIRPGPILAGVKHPYLRRRNGLEPAVYAHPSLKPILERTYGTIIFQEQLMRVAIAVGNFTPGEANEIRKNIGSFSTRGNIGRWVVKLTQGMLENGIGRSFIEEVIRQIQGFSSYGFPESHAASFALLAYASSYLKCHYPAAFFASLLNSQPMGFYQPDTLVRTARHAGVPILPVCVNRSDWESVLEPVTMINGHTQFAIRLGLNLVTGLSTRAAQASVQRRHELGDWRDLESFLAESRLTRTDLTALAAANALQAFGLDRKSAIWLAESPRYRHYLLAETVQFCTVPEAPEEEDPVLFPEETEMETVEADYRATGTSLGRHFARLLKEQAWVYPVPVEQIVTSTGLHDIRPGSTISVFGMVLVRQSPGTAKKVLFITLEDEYGTLQAVVRPRVYDRYSRLIDEQRFLCLTGNMQRIDGAVSLLVTRVVAPELKQAEVIPLEREKRYDRINNGGYTRIRNYM